MKTASHRAVIALASLAALSACKNVDQAAIAVLDNIDYGCTQFDIRGRVVDSKTVAIKIPDNAELTTELLETLCP